MGGREDDQKGSETRMRNGQARRGRRKRENKEEVKRGGGKGKGAKYQEKKKDRRNQTKLGTKRQ